MRGFDLRCVPALSWICGGLNFPPLLKELVFKFLLKAQLNIYLHIYIYIYIYIYICQYKLKGVQLGGFGSQFACSWAGADPEILVSDFGGGGSKPD